MLSEVIQQLKHVVLSAVAQRWAAQRLMETGLSVLEKKRLRRCIAVCSLAEQTK